MNVANLDLCKELYELSGWDESYFHHRIMARKGSPYPFKHIIGGKVHKDSKSRHVPAYDLGFLLRKLPKSTQVGKMTGGGYGASCVQTTTITEANTPEDAATQLAIELFKQNILTRSDT